MLFIYYTTEERTHARTRTHADRHTNTCAGHCNCVRAKKAWRGAQTHGHAGRLPRSAQTSSDCIITHTYIHTLIETLLERETCREEEEEECSISIKALAGFSGPGLLTSTSSTLKPITLRAFLTTFQSLRSLMELTLGQLPCE